MLEAVGMDFDSSLKVVLYDPLRLHYFKQFFISQTHRAKLPENQAKTT